MAKAYLVGSGIASLSAATFLILGGVSWRRHLRLRGAGQARRQPGRGGTPETGYTMRGGRMFETQFRCTYDLLSGIPSLDDPYG